MPFMKVLLFNLLVLPCMTHFRGAMLASLHTMWPVFRDSECTPDWLTTVVVLNLPNAGAFQYRSSHCGDPQP